MAMPGGAVELRPCTDNRRSPVLLGARCESDFEHTREGIIRICDLE